MSSFYSRIEVKTPPLSLSIDVSYSSISLAKFLGVSVNQSKTFTNESADILIGKLLLTEGIVNDGHKKLISCAMDVIRSDATYKECREHFPDKKTLVLSIKFFDLFHLNRGF